MFKSEENVVLKTQAFWL